MDSEDKHMNIQEDTTLKSKKRGDIKYYSISQVAALLDEDDSSIRYYTNVFDNILKIEIADKELRYTNSDVDKLEFLINLKNKGMTIKEVQKYCEELPLGIEELVEVKENNSVSVKEIIATIVELESEKISSLNNQLSNKIQECNESSVEKITKTFEAEQGKQLNLLKEDIIKELKEYIDYKFEMEYKTTKDLYGQFSLEDTIKLHLDKFNELSISRDRNLIHEIKQFKNVIERAYYIQQEMDTQKEKASFIGKLFGFR